MSKFKKGDKVRCKCHEHCDAVLVIKNVWDTFGVSEPVYEVQHDEHVLKDPHFVTEGKVEAIEVAT